jgi:PAS domain S-box-containing protein
LNDLQERSDLLDELLEQTPQSVALIGADNLIVQVNPEFTRLFGYTQEECRDRTLHELIVPVELQDAAAAFSNLVLPGHRVDVEVERQRKDGSRVHVLSVSFRIKSVGGVRLCVTHRDITRRKLSEIGLRALSAKLMRAHETERRRLACELHDEIGQQLTGLQVLLGHGLYHQATSEPMQTRIDEARSIVDNLFVRVRNLSCDLRPVELDHLGLLPALLTHIERYSQRTAIQVSFDHHGIDRRFDSRVETAAFRIVQESLTNCARHSGVDRVNVSVWAATETLNIRIDDRGCGFVPTEVLGSRGSGIFGMRERVRLLGGLFTVESVKTAGATITAQLPLTDPPTAEPAASTHANLDSTRG